MIIIFVMTYLNNNYSLDYSLDDSEAESELLKKKILEIHQKYMEEMEYTKQLEEQLNNMEIQQQKIVREN